MNYRVIWRRDVVVRLHQLVFLAYELGRDAEAIDRAVDEINRRLHQNAATEGESRDGSERVVIDHPLSVTYEVFEEAGVALIYGAVVYPRMRARGPVSPSRLMGVRLHFGHSERQRTATQLASRSRCQ